jgi:hypothetical protein
MINKNLLKDTTTTGSSDTGRKTYTYTPYTESDVVKAAGTNKTNAENALTNYINAGYIKSDDVINAEGKKTSAENALANYGDFSYSNQDMFNEVMNKILNREKFSYDLNGDALYQQYKDKYIQQGKMAMADTMGQAAAMTGGYGNSYAATVGNQAYQASLQQLNDVIPQLYQMAYDRYNQEGQDLYNQYGLLSNERSTEYGMWGDKRNTLVSDRDYYGNEANNAFNRDYGMWSDKGTMLNNDRTYHSNEYNNAYARDYAEHTTTEGYKYQDIADANAYNQWKASQDLAQSQFNWQKAQANKTVPKDTTMSTEDYSYWSDKFASIKSEADALALMDQMAVAVGDTEMAYQLYDYWNKTHNKDYDGKTDTTVYRGTNGQTYTVN